jgi:hypothetical protein
MSANTREDGSLTVPQVQSLSRQIGQALGKIANTPLPADEAGDSPARDFAGLAWESRQSRMLEDYLTISRRIQAIIICRWGEWNGDPSQVDHLRAATEDVDHYRSRMKAACHVLGRHVSVTKWFGAII